MNKDSFNIGNLKVKVKSLFYGLLTVSVLCSIVISITNALQNHDDIFTVLTAVVIFTLCSIGLIAIVLEVAKRWRYITGFIMAAFALFLIFSLPAAFNSEPGVFYLSPIILALQYISSSAWLICGVLLIINKRIFKKDEAISSGLSG